MSRSRPAAALLIVAVLAAGCERTGTIEPDLISAIDAAILRGMALLVGRQDDDGAWRSDVYGAFKTGDALTSLALRALLSVPPSPKIDRAVERGSDYLAAIAPGGSAAPPLFAVYTAAQAVEVLSASSDPRHLAARDAWLAELLGRQLTAELGWNEDDPHFGGWGYSTAVPRKPPPDVLAPPLIEANTSATVFALQGLRAAGVAPDGPVCRRALVFLQRMQNYAEPPSAFDDGGFFFIDGDPVRNKAGVAGTDEKGSTRFNSYGSTTADGLRGLLLCGRSAEDPRVRAALAWLQERFSSAEHPGTFAPRLEADRNGLFYYWAASVAQTLSLARNGPRPWAEDLARELIARQDENGAWVNSVVTMREDEPIIASAMALLALSKLREEIRRSFGVVERTVVTGHSTADLNALVKAA